MFAFVVLDFVFST